MQHKRRCFEVKQRKVTGISVQNSRSDSPEDPYSFLITTKNRSQKVLAP